MSPTHYDTLEVSSSASPEVIKAAYRSLSQRWHPDRNSTSRFVAEEQMREINAAYSVLSDSVRRQAYDEQLRAHNPNSDARVSSSGSTFGSRSKDERHIPPRQTPAQHSKASIAAAIGFLGLVLVYGLLKLPNSLLFVLAIGGIVVAPISFLLARRWRKLSTSDRAPDAARELSFALTAVVWGWIPSAIEMQSVALDLIRELPSFAVIFAAWIPAFALAKQVYPAQQKQPTTRWRSTYGLLLLMATIQTIVMYVQANLVQIQVAQAVESDPSLASHGALQLLEVFGAIFGGVLFSFLYASLLFIGGTLVSLAAVSGLRLAEINAPPAQFLCLLVGWSMPPITVAIFLFLGIPIN